MKNITAFIPELLIMLSGLFAFLIILTMNLKQHRIITNRTKNYHLAIKTIAMMAFMAVGAIMLFDKTIYQQTIVPKDNTEMPLALLIKLCWLLFLFLAGMRISGWLYHYHDED